MAFSASIQILRRAAPSPSIAGWPQIWEAPKASGGLAGSPEANYALGCGRHQLGEIYPCALDVRRRRQPVRSEPKQNQGADRRPFEADRLAKDQDRIEAVAMDQIVEARDLHPRHRRERGDRLLVAEVLGEAEQGRLGEIAGLMQ